MMSDEQLYDRVAHILEQVNEQVARTVNTVMVQAYWVIGHEFEQSGQARYCLMLPMWPVLPAIRQTSLAGSGGSIHSTLSSELLGGPQAMLSPVLAWLHYLSTEAELQIELTRERRDAERVLRLTASPDEGGES